MKKMNTVIVALLAVTSLCLMSCADDEVASDYDEYEVWSSSAADFDEYQTYRFEDIPEDVIDEAPEYVVNNHSSIKAIVAEELETLGLTEAADGEEADVVASSLAATESVEAWYADCQSGWYWWGYWDSCAWVDVYPIYYDIGTIVIPIAETATEEVVLLGVIRGIVDDSEDAEQRIKDGVEYIFNNGWN